MIILKDTLEFKKLFTLNGWPPIASHMAVFFLGVGLTNLGASGYEEFPKLSPDALIVNLEFGQELGEDIAIGDKVFVGLKKISERQEGVFCAFHDRSVKLVSIKSQASQNLALIPMKWLYENVLPEQKSRRSKLYGFLPKRAKELPACETKAPKVFYGDMN